MRSTLAAALIFASPLSAQVKSVYIEQLTWPEVRAAMHAGYTTAIIYTGSLEQNGPHMVLGKHNFVAPAVAGRIARELGHALVYPTLPYAPTGNLNPKSGHMRFPGSVTLAPETYRAVVEDVARSAVAAGFTHVFIMGDHGTGQDQLERAARIVDSTAPAGAHVIYIRELYYGSRAVDSTYLVAHGLPTNEHAGPGDTSEIMALDSAGLWIRQDQLGAARGKPEPETGVSGDPTKASVAMGRVFLQNKVDAAVAAMRRAMAR
jgi:creatinine amidohydrolase/Fe(II)-dependent formamide hydrolase-like protein